MNDLKVCIITQNRGMPIEGNDKRSILKSLNDNFQIESYDLYVLGLQESIKNDEIADAFYDYFVNKFSSLKIKINKIEIIGSMSLGAESFRKVIEARGLKTRGLRLVIYYKEHLKIKYNPQERCDFTTCHTKLIDEREITCCKGALYMNMEIDKNKQKYKLLLINMHLPFIKKDIYTYQGINKRIASLHDNIRKINTISSNSNVTMRHTVGGGVFTSSYKKNKVNTLDKSRIKTHITGTEIPELNTSINYDYFRVNTIVFGDLNFRIRPTNNITTLNNIIGNDERYNILSNFNEDLKINNKNNNNPFTCKVKSNLFVPNDIDIDIERLRQFIESKDELTMLLRKANEKPVLPVIYNELYDNIMLKTNYEYGEKKNKGISIKHTYPSICDRVIWKSAFINKIDVDSNMTRSIFTNTDHRARITVLTIKPYTQFGGKKYYIKYT